MRRFRQFMENRLDAERQASGSGHQSQNETPYNQAKQQQAAGGEPFQYKPLASPTTFRVLNLRQSLRDGGMDESRRPLRGSLVQASMQSPPKYSALSYTWGNPDPCETVEIDGLRLGITANCAAALRRMLRGKTGLCIWVDSICIDQGNSPEALAERANQVGMMDGIYRNADRVNVYLGPGDAASDVACEAIKRLAQYYLGAKLPGPQQQFFRAKYEALADDVLATTEQYPFGKLHGVFRLPWFRRTWVVQEVALGSKVFFYCGNQLIILDLMLAGADFTRLPYSKLNMASTHWRSYLAVCDTLRLLLQRREAGNPLPALNASLFNVLLSTSASLEASRPEDKIYGLYGVCKRLGYHLPAPDYQKSLGEVYTEAARAILTYDGNLEILNVACESAGWEKGIPSWVPDVSGSLRQWSASNPPHTCLSARSSAKVSGMSHAHFELVLDGQALKVKGRRLDTVSKVGQAWKTDASTGLLGDSPVQTGQVISSLLGCIESWMETIQARSDQPREMTAAILLAQVVAQDVEKPLSSSDIEGIAQRLRMLVDMSKSPASQRQPLVLAAPQDNHLTCHSVGQYTISSETYNVVLSIMGMVWKTVLGTTCGYLGVCHHTVQPEDIVAVFYGSSTAAIIRPWGDWYRFVGPAYVYGIMDGQFWHSTSDHDDEDFVLI